MAYPVGPPPKPQSNPWAILIPTAPLWVPLALVLVAVLTVARKLGIYQPKPQVAREITRGPGWDPTYGVMPKMSPRRCK